MSNWRRDKEFVENFINDNEFTFEIMQKTTNNTWKQIREDLNKKLLIEENENLIEENENLIEENENLMLEIKRLQNKIQKHKFEKTVILIVVIILLMFIIFLKV